MDDKSKIDEVHEPVTVTIEIKTSGGYSNRIEDSRQVVLNVPRGDLIQALDRLEFFIANGHYDDKE